MKCLIVSDLHANWQALEAVLSDAGNEYEQVICCGDLVGYNSQPGRVLEWTRAHASAVVRGNHDKVVANSDDIKWFNEVAQAAVRWTTKQLDAFQLEYLRGLAKGPLQHENFQIWHGSPRDEDEYVTNTREAADCFSHLERPLGFFGHTHLQGGFFSVRGRVGALPLVDEDQVERVIELEPDIYYMINPGSVGQPRDGDPRAAYALYDSDQRTVSLRRVWYAIEKTAAEIRAAGLPEMLALRLFQGL